jgi:hypothetical protein
MRSANCSTAAAILNRLRDYSEIYYVYVHPSFNSSCALRELSASIMEELYSHIRILQCSGE